MLLWSNSERCFIEKVETTRKCKRKYGKKSFQKWQTVDWIVVTLVHFTYTEEILRYVQGKIYQIVLSQKTFFNTEQVIMKLKLQGNIWREKNLWYCIY